LTLHYYYLLICILFSRSSFIPYVACLTTSCHSLTPYHSLGSCRFVSSPSIHLPFQPLSIII
jgi:hypothetical protein